ncbi:MAG: hypothetical protein M1812_004227 [Candelaria pacifica]|nr:MAG: hypothetical protein M1812_004227 [Candelaria pacifica]
MMSIHFLTSGLLAILSLLTLASQPVAATPSLVDRQSTPAGVRILPGQCAPADEAKIKTAISLLPIITTAGLNAAADFTNLPFSYFFKADYSTAAKVASIYKYTADAANGIGPSVSITCQDIGGQCGTQGALGYAGNNMIIFCPVSLGTLIPSITLPCGAINPGVYTLVSLLLHELTHIDAVTRLPPSKHIADVKPPLMDNSAAQVHSLLADNSIDTTRLGQAYALTAGWAWELGLGVKPAGDRSNWDGKPCLGNFSKGDFAAPRVKIASVVEMEGDKRRLMYGL